VPIRVVFIAVCGDAVEVDRGVTLSTSISFPVMSDVLAIPISEYD
jgi:hypothetical protein